jgi:hypothetical protein
VTAEHDGASSKLVVYESAITRERIEIDFPLSDLIDREWLRRELHLGAWVDLDEPLVRQAAVGILAGLRLGKAESDRAGRRPSAQAASARVFGGVGFRFLCPSANQNPAFRRHPKDVDYVVPRKTGERFVEALTSVHEWAGTAYFHYLRREDRQFNDLRGGKRYRVRTPALRNDDRVDSQVADVFAGELSFCHRIPLDAEFEKPGVSLSLACLVITKAQFIKEMPRREVEGGYEHAVLAELGTSNVAVGMEEKDVIDVGAAFLDGDDGTLSSDIVALVNGTRDWGLWRTVSLNLGNSAAAEKVLDDRGVEPATRRLISDRMARTVSALAAAEPPRPRLRFRKTWWEAVEES